MHECPRCGQACDCDGEDTWFEYPYNMNCACDCDEADDRDYDDEDYGEDEDARWEAWYEAMEETRRPSRWQAFVIRVSTWLYARGFERCAVCGKFSRLFGKLVGCKNDCVPF